MSAFAWVPDDHLEHSWLRERYRENLLERTEIRLRTAVAVVQRENPAVEIDHQVMVGSPHAVLRCEARHAQFVVVGDRGLSRVEGLFTGSVTVALAAHAACPVVVVRGIERAPSAIPSLPVVVGVDGSPTSDEAVAFAFEAAAARQVRLVAVHTWWNLLAEQTLAPLYDRDAIKTDERQLLAERLAVWAEKYPDPGSSAWSPVGIPPEACLRRRPARSSSSLDRADGVSPPGCSSDRSVPCSCTAQRVRSPSSRPQNALIRAGRPRGSDCRGGAPIVSRTWLRGSLRQRPSS